MDSLDRSQMLRELEGFCSIPSVAGDEAQLAEHLRKLYLEAGAERVEVDLAGNVLAWKGNPDRAVVAHLDTVGFMVEHPEEDHCVLATVGYPSTLSLQRGVLSTRTGEPISGLIQAERDGSKPVFQPLDAAAMERIQVGDRVAYAPHFEVAGDYLTSPYLDNRVGCWMTLEAMRRSENLMALCTTNEETTCSGARQAGAAMDSIDSVLVVDATYGEGYLEPARVQLGAGPVLSLMDQNMPPKKATEAVRNAAEQAGIKLQFEVTDAGSSDMSSFMAWRRPVLCCFFGVASRHNHQPFEVIHLGDLEQAVAVVNQWGRLGRVCS